MKKHTDLKRLNSIDKISDILANKAQAVVLTNQDGTALENNKNNDDTQIYENDFDLYILLKDMLNSKLAEETSKEDVKKKSKNQFKDYTKSLTATVLPTHYVNGDNSWALHDNGFEMYRSETKCIGTDLADCGFGEPVFLDLQPLSTRIELMCKLIIIIQGACLERAGPPKLVQDRCIQFDGPNKSEENKNDSQSKINKIKSISCETLISDTGFNDIKFFDSDTEIKIRISSSSQSGMSKKPHLSYSDDEGLNDIEKNDDYSYNFVNNIGVKLNRSGDNVINKIDAESSCYDMEHYFKYRLSKSSQNKDYASATYYQYSSNNHKGNVGTEKEINTEDSYVTKMKRDEEKMKMIKSFVSKSTETDASNLTLDTFTRNQILSPRSLFKEKSRLVDASTSTDDGNPLLNYIIEPLEKSRSRKQEEEAKCLSRTEIPISICTDNTDAELFTNKDVCSFTHRQEYQINLKDKNQKTIEEHRDESTKNDSDETKINNNIKLVQASTVKNSTTSLKTRSRITASNSSSRPKSWVFKFTNCFESDDDREKLEQIKAGPKKSHEWTIFKSNSNRSKHSNDDESDSDGK